MSSLKAWEARAKPHSLHSHPHIGLLYNAPADPEGFTMALFTPDIAVDTRGKVLILKPADFKGLIDRDLAGQLKDIPGPGTFRNTWQIQPIDRLMTSSPSSTDVYQPASVQGWDMSLPELKLTWWNLEEREEMGTSMGKRMKSSWGN